MIFDTHAHYDDEAFANDREELLDGMNAAGIDYIVNIGANMASSRATVALCDRYPFIYGTVGIHPSETEECNEAALLELKAMAAHEKIVAIGEIGLDYYWPEPDKSVQIPALEAQIALAKEVDLPLVIHSRDAARDTADILRSTRAGECGGVIHCFSYTKEMAREFLDMGFHIGVGGVVTFQNGKKLKDVVEYIPMDRLVIETDCPYLAPVPYRGKRNSSLYLPYVLETIGQIKQMTPEEVAAVTMENAKRMYKIR